MHYPSTNYNICSSQNIFLSKLSHLDTEVTLNQIQLENLIYIKDVNLTFYCFTYAIFEDVNDGTVYNFKHQASWMKQNK